MHLHEMDDKHLRNALLMMERNVEGAARAGGPLGPASVWVQLLKAEVARRSLAIQPRSRAEAVFGEIDWYEPPEE